MSNLDSPVSEQPEITSSGRVLLGGQTVSFVVEEDGVWAAFQLVDEINWGLSFWSDGHTTREEALRALPVMEHP